MADELKDVPTVTMETMETIFTMLKKLPIDQAINIIDGVKTFLMNIKENNPCKTYYVGPINWDETEKITFRNQERFGMSLINGKYVCRQCERENETKSILVIREGNVITNIRLIA